MDKSSLRILSVVLVFWLVVNSLNPFFSSYALSLGIDTQKVSFLIAFVSIVRFVIQPILSIVLTKQKYNLTLSHALCIMALSNLLYALTTNFPLLLLSRAIEAIAVGLFTIQIRMVINNSFCKEKIVAINDYYAGIKNISALCGPAIAGIIIQYFGFQCLCFVFLIIVSAFVLFLFIRKQDYDLKSRNLSLEEVSYLDMIKDSGVRQLAWIHFIEMAGFSLWITSWAVFAKNDLCWDESSIGLSFSLAAFGGIIVLPFSKRWFVVASLHKMLMGLLFLSIQAFLVVLLSNYPAWIYFVFLLGGAGGTLYFSGFHSYSANVIEKKQTAMFYGLIGSISYLAVSAGQMMAPYLWKHFSFSTPILLDGMLLSIVLIYFLFRISFRRIAYE
jgi:predicted MFS family arabinose efflux permease